MDLTQRDAETQRTRRIEWFEQTLLFGKMTRALVFAGARSALGLPKVTVLGAEGAFRSFLGDRPFLASSVQGDRGAWLRRLVRLLKGRKRLRRLHPRRKLRRVG